MYMQRHLILNVGYNDILSHDKMNLLHEPMWQIIMQVFLEANKAKYTPVTMCTYTVTIV